MLLPTGVTALFTVAYQSTKHGYLLPCSRFEQQPIKTSCRSSSVAVVLTSTNSDCEHDGIDDKFIFAHERNDDASVTSKAATITIAQFFTKPRLTTIFKGRRRNGLPRTTITDRSNIQQHVIHLLTRLGRESCLVTTLSLLLYRVTSSSSRASLTKFISTNLTRWVAASLSMKLLTLHSQITVVVDQSTPLTQNANNMDEDWFLKGEFHVNFQNDTVHDEYLLINTNTSVYNTTAIATSNNNDSTLVRIRQVPSDGSCLFHAIGARLVHDEWLYHQSTEQQHERNPPMSSVMECSSKLRQQAVNALQDNPQRQFTITQDEKNEVPITASSLVELAADPYGISSDEYLTSMRDESVWGGGPEIIALASELKRQIVVLEQDESASSSGVCFLKVRARFGDAVFNDGSNSIYVLSANQQFPESRGRGRIDCNHFLAVFAFGSV